MILRHRPLPAVWPGPNVTPRGHQFKASWANTLNLLDQELTYLKVRGEVWLAVDVSESDIRLDGQVRANARPRSDRVILSFEHPKVGDLSYPCATFTATWSGQMPGWQANVRAIALGLEALRAVDRYGITARGEQYQGFRELGAGIPLGPPAFTVESAARFLAEMSGAADIEDAAVSIIVHPPYRSEAYRAAARRHHPDVGGDTATFQRINEAKELLDREAGV